MSTQDAVQVVAAEDVVQFVEGLPLGAVVRAELTTQLERVAAPGIPVPLNWRLSFGGVATPAVRIDRDPRAGSVLMAKGDQWQIAIVGKPKVKSEVWADGSVHHQLLGGIAHLGHDIVPRIDVKRDHAVEVPESGVLTAEQLAALVKPGTKLAKATGPAPRADLEKILEDAGA